MQTHQLETTARELVAKGKGILAADESFKTIQKRFDAIDIESTADTRRSYREMLFSTPGVEEYISGVILFDETIRQVDTDGTPLRDLLTQKGIKIGIKVDEGTQDLANLPNEKITEGLDGLRNRLSEYRDLGASFAKWRAVITIGPGIPTRTCMEANAKMLAIYAALSQEAGLVPIVEPEVLMDGDHNIEQCTDATEAALRSVFAHLMDHRVYLEGLLLKSNMVLPGKKSPDQVSVGVVAEETVKLLRRVVPAAVPGIVFLSGGQDSVHATEHLNAMNNMGDLPWHLSFSYSRALQEDALKAWAGSDDNKSEAQRVFYKRARCNGAATRGQYTGEMERLAA